MDSKDAQILIYIYKYCKDAETAVERFGNEYCVFDKDTAYLNSVSMCVFQIGELSNRLSDDFRQQTKEEMPWGLIRGMRNQFAHGYGEMSKEIIWEVVRDDLPKLATFCEGILKKSNIDVAALYKEANE